MKKISHLGTLAVASIILIGCGGGGGGSAPVVGDRQSYTPTDNNTYVTPSNPDNTHLDHSQDVVAKNSATNLMWTAAKNGFEEGTYSRGDAEKPFSGDNSKTISYREMEKKCEGLAFAGFDDWRAPTATEVSGYFKSFTNSGNDFPYIQTEEFYVVLGNDGTEKKTKPVVTFLVESKAKGYKAGDIVQWSEAYDFIGLRQGANKLLTGILCVRPLGQ